MMDVDQLFWILGTIVVVAPSLLLAAIGIPMVLGVSVQEGTTARFTQTVVLAGLVCSLTILVLMLTHGIHHVPVEFGNWFALPEEHSHFHLSFIFDRLSVPFVILTFVLVGTISAFASRYLHRESGYHRFFLLNAMFLMGMVLAIVAGTIETLFVGWELVGLSSALLIAYFHERPSPVRNGQWVWSVYRIADAAFLLAALLLHHLNGEGDFEVLMGQGDWPVGHAILSSRQALVVGLLFLVAAAGKSALIPFSGWLPRAMEGPTPSSAIFYGALSVHLGTYLLLRVSPILELSGLLCACVIGLGLSTALLAAMTARVQTDVKSALAYASLTQVGIITAEIGMGFRYLALIHIIGHACLRTLQLLRAPNLLRDYHGLENAIGARLPRRPGLPARLLSDRARRSLYRLALERGNLDALIRVYVVRPFLAVFSWCNAMEMRWTNLLAGKRSSKTDQQAAGTSGEGGR
ncbi:proton-conducting transporter membrane subunit [Planctomicrobium sp. SH661]|uniref:proton-conducting transporter transmembrane domain-containing protein n=1 Tax=Planctomicrobium sp. SH661 TaxID=3448124 RepID=UPI003F5B84C1